MKQHLEDTLNKEKFYTYYQLACEFIGKNELVEAEENLKTSIKLNEFYAPSLRNLAALYLKQKKYKEAEELLLK